MESTNIRVCNFDGCGLPYSARGYCRTHYEQLRLGRPLAPIKKIVIGSVADRIAAHTDRSGSCWVWTGYVGDEGYGRINIGPVPRLAHRVAFELAGGTIPDGYVIDHKCHNRACVRPAHLHAVSHKQNVENRAGATKNSKSGIRGVSWHKPTGTWVAQVGHNRRVYNAGYFDRIEDAEAAAIAKRLELHTNNLLDRA